MVWAEGNKIGGDWENDAGVLLNSYADKYDNMYRMVGKMREALDRVERRANGRSVADRIKVNELGGMVDKVQRYVDNKMMGVIRELAGKIKEEDDDDRSI